MGYILNDWQEEQRRKNEAGNPAAPSNVGIVQGPETTAPAVSDMTAPTPAAQKPQSPPVGAGTGSGYINLSSYLDANRGAASELAGKLAGDVNAAGQKVQTDLAGVQGKYDAAVKAGSVTPYNPGPLDRAGTENGRGTPGAPQGIGYFDPLSGQNRTYEVPGDAGVQAAADRAGRQYSGPTSVADIEGYGDVASAARDVSERAANLGSISGRQALLQEQAKGPYGRGASLLDAYLTGAAGTGLADAEKQNSGLADTVLNAAGETTKADTARTTSAQASGDAQRYLDQQTAARDSAQQAQGTLDDQYAAYARHTNLSHMSRDDFARLTPEQRQALSMGATATFGLRR